MEIEELITNYKDRIASMARSFTKNAALQEDLCQEGYIALWKAVQAYDPKRGALPSWIVMRVHSAMIKVIRNEARGRLVPSEFIELPYTQDLDITGMYHRTEIQEAVNNLTDRQREYVTLRFWEDMQNRELTEYFGYEPSSLWTNKKQGARTKLRRELAHLHDGRISNGAT